MDSNVGEGWRPDPTGRHQWRYFQNSVWTDQVADDGKQSSDPYEANPGMPLGQQPQSPQQPVDVNVQQPKRKWPWIGCAVVVAFVVLLGGGCAVLIAVSLNNAVEELNVEQASHAITKKQFDSVEIGSTKAEVIARLGKKPESSQEFVSEGVVKESELKSSCIYYNRTGETFGSRYQFCFEDDRLTSKNSY